MVWNSWRPDCWGETPEPIGLYTFQSWDSGHGTFPKVVSKLGWGLPFCFTATKPSSGQRHQTDPGLPDVARFWQVYSMSFSFGSLGLCGNGSNFGRKLGDPNFYINHFGLLEHVVTSIHAQNSRVVQFEFQLQASTCSRSWSFAATNCPSRNCGCCSLRTAAATTPRAEPWAMSWQPSWSCWRAKQCWNWMQAEKQLGESCDALIF